jgi:predicted MPP superfamily phosphohydrolase
LLYFTLALLTIEVVRLSDKLFPWYPAWIRNNRRKTGLALFFTVTGSVACLMVYGYHQVVCPKVRHVNLSIPKSAGGRDSLTVVMMSDLHIGEIIGKKQVEKFVSMSNAQHPDLVVLVGDLIDYEVRYAERMRAENDLRRLEAPLGVYAVYGNHEYRANRHAKTRWIKQTGATLLVDSTVWVDSAFYLVGRDDYVNKERKPLASVMKGVDREKPVILLDHQPLTLAEAAMNGIDLGLYGHTHNGQYWPYPLFLRLVYECVYGYYRKGDSQFYISSGIGVAGPPYRVGTSSEMVVLHITFTRQPQL